MLAVRRGWADAIGLLPELGGLRCGRGCPGVGACRAGFVCADCTWRLGEAPPGAMALSAGLPLRQVNHLRDSSWSGGQRTARDENRGPPRPPATAGSGTAVT